MFEVGILAGVQPEHEHHFGLCRHVYVLVRRCRGLWTCFVLRTLILDLALS